MRPLKTIVSLLTAVVALSGCTKADLFNVIIPNGGYSVHKDIAYGDNPRQILDIYEPEKHDAHNSVVVFFYGGSWQKGYKELYKFVGQAFTSKGYTVVVVNYRLYPEIYFPDFMNDAAQSVAWVHKNIGQYGGDPSHIYVSGHSAGGYMSVMLALNESYLKAVGGSTKWIKGAIGISGPYDFLPFTDPKIIAIFSKANGADTQPINFARKHTPPILLLTAEQDDEVSAKNTLNLSQKMRELDNPVEAKIYHEVGHIGIVLSLAQGFRNKAPTLEDITDFIEKTNQAKQH